jgi:hypothetical protein
MGSYRENSLKTRYLLRKKPWARTLSMVNIVHEGLQDALSPDWKALRQLGMFPRKYFSSGLCFIFTINSGNFSEKCVPECPPYMIFGLSSNKFWLCKILKLFLSIQLNKALISLSVYILLIRFTLDLTDEFLRKMWSSWFFISAKVDQILTVKFNFLLNIECVLFDFFYTRNYDVSLASKALFIINKFNWIEIWADKGLVPGLIGIY